MEQQYHCWQLNITQCLLQISFSDATLGKFAEDVFFHGEEVKPDIKVDETQTMS